METMIVTQVEEAILSYLLGYRDSDELEDWLDENTRGAHRWSQRAQDLVFGSDMAIWSYNDGYITEEQLREELTVLLNGSATTAAEPVSLAGWTITEATDKTTGG